MSRHDWHLFDGGNGDVRALAALPPNPDHPANARLDNALIDWKLLLGAVSSRLQRFAGPPQEPRSLSASALLECAEALEQLHTMLVNEVGRRRQLDQELFDLRMTVAMSEADAAAAAENAPADTELLLLLGAALVHEWRSLPMATQRALYDRAVAGPPPALDTELRRDMAVFLHDNGASARP